MTELGTITRRDLGTAAAIATLSFVVYLALGQGVLYGDGAEFMVLLHSGSPGHKNHLAYIPLLRLAAQLGAPLGISAFVAARLCSQLGAALGVALLHLASCRLGLPRAQATWLTVLIASSPSLLFFASVVEVHAPYFACLGAAWLVTAHAARTPTAASGALLGASTALAYFGHASGLVLPGPLLLATWHLSGRPLRTLWPLATACAAVHLLLCLGVPWLLQNHGQTASPAGAARFMVWWGLEIVRQPTLALLVIWDEWLLAYLPVSLLWLRAFGCARASAWVALLALCPYLALSLALLAVYREFGAYQHAVLWLFAWLTVRYWGRPVLALAAVLALAVGIWRVVGNDDPQRVHRYLAGLDASAQGATPLLIVAAEPDYEACFIGRPGLAFVDLAAPDLADPTHAAASQTAMVQRLQKHIANGGRVFLTAGAIGSLGAATAAAPQLAYAQLRARIESEFQLVPALNGTFQAMELRTR